LVKEKGVRLGITTNLSTGESHVGIKLEAIPGKRIPRGFNVIPSYCPFCGEKYTPRNT
jgi:hypothetical protein